MTNEGNGEQRRRHHRVGIDIYNQHYDGVLGITAQLDGEHELKVLDMSYAGAALQNQVDLKPGKVLRVEFLHKETSLFSAQAKVVWSNYRVMGLEFIKLEPKDRLQLNEFLSDKLVGVTLKPIPRDLFGPRLDCSTWYHGAKDTNIYLWGEASKLTRAIVEFEEVSMEYRDGELYFSGPGRPTGMVRRDEVDFALNNQEKSLFLRRLIDVLLQVSSPTDILGDLLRRLERQK